MLSIGELVQADRLIAREYHVAGLFRLGNPRIKDLLLKLKHVLLLYDI